MIRPSQHVSPSVGHTSSGSVLPPSGIHHPSTDDRHLSSAANTRGTSLLDLHEDALTLVIRCLIDDPMIDPRTKLFYDYYCPAYESAQGKSTSTLLNLCRTCRKLHAIAAPFLYRNITLKRLQYPKFLEEQAAKRRNLSPSPVRPPAKALLP